MDVLREKPEVILQRERLRWQKGIFLFLAVGVVFLTIVLLINPAVTEEYAPQCGYTEHTHTEECYSLKPELICPLEGVDPETVEAHVHGEDCYQFERVCVCGLDEDPEHEHTDECFEEKRTLICEKPEIIIHEHTAECIEWQKELVCSEDHEHTDECFEEVPVFVCKDKLAEELDPAFTGSIVHVHNEYCYQEKQVLICGLEEHTHSDSCYPQLTGNPHADVEIPIDWESSFCNVPLTGVWSDDLINIAFSQLGYHESVENFITDEYNVKHGYTRYGEWYGNRYASWDTLFVMFCLHYADVWNIPTDSVAANWMNSVTARELLREDGLPLRGDIVFFDENANELADLVAIVTSVDEDGFWTILGGTQYGEVREERFQTDDPRIMGFLALPENPNYVDPDFATLDSSASEEQGSGEEDLRDRGEERGEDSIFELTPVTLSAFTSDGLLVTLTTDLPYPEEELSLTAELLDSANFTDELVQIEEDSEKEGREVTSALLFDVNVWRTTVPAAPAASEEVSEEELIEDPAVPTADPSAEGVENADEAGETADPADPDAADPDAESVENADEAGEASDPAGETDLADNGGEELPEGEESAEPIVERIALTGPFEIIVEGLEGNGEITVFRFTENGMEELAATRTERDLRFQVN